MKTKITPESIRFAEMMERDRAVHYIRELNRLKGELSGLKRDLRNVHFTNYVCEECGRPYATTEAEIQEDLRRQRESIKHSIRQTKDRIVQLKIEHVRRKTKTNE